MNVGDLLAFVGLSALFGCAASLLIYGVFLLIDDWRDQ